MKPFTLWANVPREDRITLAKWDAEGFAHNAAARHEELRKALSGRGCQAGYQKDGYQSTSYQTSSLDGLWRPCGRKASPDTGLCKIHEKSMKAWFLEPAAGAGH